MNQLVTLGTTTVGNKLLDTISTISQGYVRYKWFRDDSLDSVPYLIGNTTQTLLLTNNFLSLAKDFTGNFSDSLVPSFHYLVSNQTRVMQAQTSLLVTQDVMLNNRLLCHQGMTVTTGTVLTCMSLGETISSTNMVARVCFASATLLNAVGTVCSAANMITNVNRGLNPFGVFFNSLGMGCFWGARYCQQLGNRTRFF